jgi:hypothetical protein
VAGWCFPAQLAFSCREETDHNNNRQETPSANLHLLIGFLYNRINDTERVSDKKLKKGEST